MIIRGQSPAEKSFKLPPMSDLENQITFYYEKIQRDIEDLEMNPNFSDGVESLYRDANMFILILKAVATSPEESPLKPATPALITVAQNLTQVKNLEEAKAGFEKFQDALQSKGDASAINWTRSIKLAPVMKKGLPALSTEIKRLTRNEKTFQRAKNAEKVLGASAALVTVAIGCRPNVDETLAPNDVALWEQYCNRLYESAIKFNEMAHQVTSGAATFDKLSQAFEEIESTCNSTCHEKFGGNTSN